MTGMLASPDDAQSDAATWAIRIAERWRASVEAIIDVGRLLNQAKASLAHGEFGRMIEASLPFSASTAQRLMAIARDARLSDAAHVQHLPASWGTLYELTQLSDDEFATGIQRKIIRPDMERKEISEFAKDVTKPNGSRAIMGSRHEAPDSLDYFPTPPWATRALIEHVLPQVGRRGDCRRQTAWEPACGEGHIAEVLCEYFRAVFATDIHDYGYGHFRDRDFLEVKTLVGGSFDWIITNPPFGELGEAFVLNAIRLASSGVAMFMRVQWLDTIGRYERIFRDQPPTLIAFFAERVPLCKGRWDPDGDTATAYMWLVWIKGAEPRAPFWIPPGQRKALTRDDDVERFTARPVMKRVRDDVDAGEVA